MVLIAFIGIFFVLVLAPFAALLLMGVGEEEARPH